MLLIRGNTRVADIYLTEFDRIFRHFYFRNIANELAAAKTSDDATAIFLDETDAWSDSYFKPGTFKSNRRLMFFDKPTTTWSANAAEAGEGNGSQPGKKKPTVKKKSAPKKKPAAKKKSTKKKATTKRTPGKRTASKKSKKKAPKASKKISKKKTSKAAKKRIKRR